MITGILKRALLLIAFATGTAVSAQAQFTVTSQTTDWQVVPYKPGLVTDYPSDQQTGSGEADIVGGGILPSFYTKFIAGATNTTGTTYFRVRLGADDSPAGFKGACFLGVDANNDGKLDVFFGVDNSGSSNGIFVWKAGTGANISPSTTSISSSTPSFTYAQTTANYSWRIVDAVIDPAADTAAKLNTDGRTGTGQTDYFISFSLPFADVVAACAQVGISGVTSETTLRYVVGTATQANAFNQDLNGVQGGVNSSATWESLGAISLPLNVTGQVVNTNPVAVNDTSTTNEDSAVNISVLANDTDADGDTLTVSAVTQSANGVVTFTSSGVTFTPAQNYFGTASFTYTTSDGKGGTATATVTVPVNPVNDAPVAVNDSATTDEDTAININVLANDSDVDGDTLTVTSVTQPANGTVTFTSTGVTFTPATNFNGGTTFTYSISDGRGGTSSATVSVTVSAVNDAPVAQNDTLSTNQDTPRTLNVLANDSDVDGDSLVITGVTQPVGGSVTFTAAEVTFSPNPKFSGTTSFTYTISDGRGGTAAAAVAVVVTPLNDAPIAQADVANTNEDTAVFIPVLANDSDTDGDTLAVQSVTQSTEGAVTFTAAGVTFTPRANFHGTTTFTYTITDGNGGTATAEVTVTVVAVNDAPIAQGDTASTDEDTPVTISVLNNDYDVDDDTLVIESVTQSSHGSVAITPSAVTFSPAADFNGTATFAYTISDGQGGTATATVDVTVNAVNDAPVASPDNVTVEEEMAVMIPVLANDTDVDGDTLSVASVTQSQDGVVTFTATGVTFTPAINFTGVTSFTYTISDGKGGTGSATVTVNVTDVNDAPLAQNDTSVIDEDTAVVISVLGNDSDADGDNLVIESVTQSANGTVAFTSSAVTFTPTPNFHGSTGFTYTIADGKGGTAVATVTVTVNAVNDAPVAQDDAVTTEKNVAITIPVLVNDTDIDGDIPVVKSVTQGTDGTVTFDATAVTFTPAANFHGSTSFTYTISDGNGGTASARVFVTVVNTNSAPVAVDDVQEGTEDTPVTLNVLENDTDSDGDSLAVTSAPLVSGQGTLRVNDNGTVTFTPARDFNGTVTFTYGVTDGKGGTATGNAVINVAPVNDLPIAVNDTASTPQERPVTVEVLSNDSDVETANLTVRSAHLLSGSGTVVVTLENEVQFIPAPGFIGTAVLSYTVEDANGGTASALVSIEVNGLPVANADYVTTQPNQAVTFNVLANDVDPEGLPLIITEATINPLLGTFVIGSNGLITYTPAASLTGEIVGEYAVRDAAGNATKAKIYITIAQNPPPNPVALPDAAETMAGTPVTVNVLRNDSDPSGSALTVVSADLDPLTGYAVINPDGTITFTPAKGFQGTATVTYTIRNATGQSASSTLVATVLPEPAAPVALPDIATVVAGTTKEIAVLTNDVDPDGGVLSLDSVVITAGAGEASIANGKLQFVAPSTPQVVTLTYTVCNSGGTTASTTVTVTVFVETTNSAPIAVNDAGRTPVGVAVELNVLTNDLDPDGDAIVLVDAAVSAQQGTVQFTPAGAVKFVPVAGFNDVAVITYTIRDGNGGTAIGTLTINVNDNPIAVTDFATTLPATGVTVRVLANDMDPNGNPLSVVAATVDTMQGSVTVEHEGAILFTPRQGFTGTAELSYTIVDGKGGTAEGTVHILVNTPPVAAVDRVGTLIGAPVTISVLSNDTDAESDDLAIGGATVDPAQGTVGVNPDGTITFTPGPFFAGTATITYVLIDSKGGASTGTVLVNRENAQPTAESRRVYTYCETPVMVNPLRTAGDPDGDTLRVVQVGNPAKGTLKQRADGMLLYTPNRNFSGKVEDSFSVVLSDSNGGLVETVIRVSAFSAIAGRFEGLLVDGNEDVGTRAPNFRGRITVNLTGRATLSAKMEIDGRTQTFVGALTGALEFERKIRIGGRQMVLLLKYDDINDCWTATVSGPGRKFVNGTAIGRLSSSKRELAGRYGAHLTGVTSGEIKAAGAAQIRVRSSGTVSIVGYLPDGRPFSDSALLTGEGQLSLYTLGITGVLKGAASAVSSPITGTLLWKTSPESVPLDVTSSPVTK